MTEWFNRFLCWLTGSHIYSSGYLFEIFPKCNYCKRDLDERCTGWEKK